MSNFSSMLDTFGRVYLESKRSPSEQLAWMKLRQSEEMQALYGAVGSIEVEIAELRQAHMDGLAAQQQIIQQEQIQAHLEELIYSIEKMVQHFTAADCDVSPSIRYFNLRSVRDSIAQQGIATPVIRGRENKAAFEKVMAAVQQMLGTLEKDSEVKEALVWAEKEDQRIREAQNQAQSQKEARRQQIAARLAELNGSLRPSSFIDWYSSNFDAYLNRKPPYENLPLLKKLPPVAYKIVATILLWYLPGMGLIWIPIWRSMSKKKDERDRVAQIQPEIARLQAELGTL